MDKHFDMLRGENRSRRQTSCLSVFCACTAALVLIAPAITQAGLLSNGPTTRDTETGIDWLDLTFTDGQFPFQVLTNLATTFPGYRQATAAEALSLFSAVGLAPDISHSLGAYTAVDTLHTFLGALNTFDNGARVEVNSVGVVSDVGPSGGSKRVAFRMRTDVNFSFNEFSGTLQEEERALGLAAPDTGVFLVRSVTNGTATTPLAPGAIDPLTHLRTFSGAPGEGVWYELAGGPVSPGLLVSPAIGAMITHIGLPSSFTDLDNQAAVIDPTLGEVILTPGQIHAFSSPVGSLALTGIGFADIAPAGVFTIASDGPESFPLFLRFDTPTVEFTAGAVPEPTTLSLVAVGLVALRRRRR